MALKKTAGETAGTAKKTAAKAGVAKKAAPKTAAGAGTTATATKKAAPKKAAPKKAAGPKLSEPQHEMLKKVAGAGETGYHAAKKPENKTLETLLKHKLVKKGKKHESGNYHYAISKAGQKHLETSAAAGSSAPKSS